MKKWVIEESHTVFEDRWVHLRSDTVLTGKGERLSPYYVHVNRDWACTIAFSPDGKILLQRQYRHGVGDFLWELPGGTVDEGEEVEVANAREFLEETGCQAARFEKIARFTPNPASQTNWAHFFIGYDAKKVQEPNWDTGEEMEFRWFTVEELLEFIDAGNFVQGHHLGALFLALRKRNLLGR